MQLFCLLFIILTSHVFAGTSTVGRLKSNLFYRKNPVIGIFGAVGDKLRTTLTLINNENVYTAPEDNIFYISPQLFINCKIYRTLVPMKLPCPHKMEVNHLIKEVPFMRKFNTRYHLPILYTHYPAQIGLNIWKRHPRVKFSFPCTEKQSKLHKEVQLINSNNDRDLLEINKDDSILKSTTRKEEIVTSLSAHNNKNIQNNSFHHLKVTDKKDSKVTRTNKKDSRVPILSIVNGKVKSDNISNITDVSKDVPVNNDSQTAENTLDYLRDNHQEYADNKVNESIITKLKNKKGILKMNEIKRNVNTSLEVSKGNNSASDAYISNNDKENQNIIDQKNGKEVIVDNTTIINENEFNVDNTVHNQDVPILSDVPKFLSDNPLFMTVNSVDNNQDNLKTFEINFTESSTETSRGDIPISSL